MENLLILDTHYGVVRYLYNDIFKKKRSQINDLQNQIMFLSCLNKYMLCRTGQFAQLYGMYSSLNSIEIMNYYENNRSKMNMTANEWINFSTIIAAPRVLPKTVDGPYLIDSMSLRRYTHFWAPGQKMVSNILAAPFFCLDGPDYLYYEMINWKSMCEQRQVEVRVNTKNIFHETFYIVEFPEHNVKFLIWLDDVDVESELYVIESEPEYEDENPDVSYDLGNISLLKRIYIACSDNLMFYKILNLENPDPLQKILNIFFNYLTPNFVVTFDGKGPRNMKSAILDITNSAPNYDGVLDFNQVSRLGFNADKNDQIYEIESLSQLNVSMVRTPYFLIFQEQINVTSHPTVAYMLTKLQEFLFFMSAGMINKNIYTRMYAMPSGLEGYPAAMKKQLSIIYMQKYKKFSLNRQHVDFNPTFYDNMYVFSARNLLCTVKSIKYVLRDVISSPPLLPPCAMLIQMEDTEEMLYQRLTQNILYLRRLQTLCFLKDFTLQELTKIRSSMDDEGDDVGGRNRDMKTIYIMPENKIRSELNMIFTHTDINKFETNTVVVYEGIELKCIRLNRDLNFELYYFVQGIKDENNLIDERFKGFFEKFMQSPITHKKLGDKIYTIFMHLLNLYVNDVIL